MPDEPQKSLMPLLTPAEVAAILRVDIETLVKWRHRGGGPPYQKIGRRVRYSQASLEAWITARERKHTSDPGPTNVVELRRNRRD